MKGHIMRILALISCFFLTVGTADAQRLPDTTADRLFIGLAIGQTAPEGQIFSWDSTALDDFLDTRLAELDAQITDSKIRAMAVDLTLRQTSEGKTHYYQSTYDAFDVLWDGQNQNDYEEALYIFITTAKRGDPFGYEGIELYYGDGYDTLPPNISLNDLTRKAADLDLLPAIERLTYNWMYGDAVATPDTIEAYIRYAMDIAGEDGFPAIISKVLDFYVHQHNDRPADGYALRALEIYERTESLAWVEDYRSFMYRHGVDLPQDDKLQLDAAIRSVIHGNDRMHRTIGYLIMNGLGADQDFDLARDVLMDCYQQNNDAHCLSNLGNIYAREENPAINVPLSFALYTFAAEIDPEVSAIESDYIAELDDYMYQRERTVANLYLTQIRAGDFSTLPNLGQARPVDYTALLAERESQ